MSDPARRAASGGGAASCARQPSAPSSAPAPADQPGSAPHRPRFPHHRRSGGPSVAELRRAARTFAHRSRAEQGLGPHISDPEVIAKLVVLFRPTDTDTADHGRDRDGEGSRC